MATVPKSESSSGETVEIPITSASHAQLIWFSKMHGLDVDPAETEGQTLNRLKLVWDHPTIKVPAVIQEPKKASVRGKAFDAEQDASRERYGLPETVTIMINNSSGSSKDSEIPAVNGVAYRIKYNEPVEVPWFVFTALQDSRAIHYQQGRDSGLGDGVEVPTITMSRLK